MRNSQAEDFYSLLLKIQLDEWCSSEGAAKLATVCIEFKKKKPISGVNRSQSLTE